MTGLLKKSRGVVRALFDLTISVRVSGSRLTSESCPVRQKTFSTLTPHLSGDTPDVCLKTGKLEYKGNNIRNWHTNKSWISHRFEPFRFTSLQNVHFWEFMGSQTCVGPFRKTRVSSDHRVSDLNRPELSGRDHRMSFSWMFPLYHSHGHMTGGVY